MIPNTHAVQNSMTRGGVKANASDCVGLLGGATYAMIGTSVGEFLEPAQTLEPSLTTSGRCDFNRILDFFCRSATSFYYKSITKSTILESVPSRDLLNSF